MCQFAGHGSSLMGAIDHHAGQIAGERPYLPLLSLIYSKKQVSCRCSYTINVNGNFIVKA